MPYDVFVSYAHVDNKALPGADEGWVTTLVKGLKGKLAQELGRAEACRLWMDYELRGNDSITRAIHEILDQTSNLVLFLSKGYLASDWCLQELNSFVRRVGADSKTLFVVYVAPVDELPEALADKKKYAFWKEDESGRARTFAVPVPDPTQRAYYDLLEDLARDLAAEILASRSTRAPRHEPVQVARASDPVEEREEPAPTAPPRSQPPLPRPRESARDEVIFLNAGEDDLALVREVGRCLQANGYGCAIPLRALPGFDTARVRPTELRRDLEQNLKSCDSVVMLYRSGPVNQLREHISAWRSAAARRRRAAPPLAVFQEDPDPLAIGVSCPGMNVRTLSRIHPEECLKILAEAAVELEEGER
jgi:hypothetical protein